MLVVYYYMDEGTPAVQYPSFIDILTAALGLDCVFFVNSLFLFVFWCAFHPTQTTITAPCSMVYLDCVACIGPFQLK